MIVLLFSCMLIRLELNDLQKQYGSVIEEILLVLKSRIIVTMMTLIFILST